MELYQHTIDMLFVNNKEKDEVKKVMKIQTTKNEFNEKKAPDGIIAKMRAKQYSRICSRRKEIKATAIKHAVMTISALLLAGVFTYCISDKEVPASTEETTTVETTTEEITTETQTTVVKVECIVRDVVGDTITVECDGELYAFYGDGYSKGQKVVCTFENDKITNASEPVIEEKTEETKFFNVPLAEEIQLHIMAECDKYNIAPALIIAIIERESNYDIKAIGDNGNSLGLMQIQPKWHQWRMDAIGGGDWFNPCNNVSVGIHILNGLFEKYGEDIHMVLMEYNGGSSYAKKMQNKGIVSDYALSIVERATQLEEETYGGIYD